MNAVEPDPHALAGAYACDALEPGEREQFERHLDGCEQCTAEVQGLHEVTALLAIAVAAPPPATLKVRVDARIQAIEQSAVPRAVVEQAPARRRGALSGRAGWAVAVALAGVVAGLSVHTVTQHRQIASISAQASTLLQVLAAPDAATVRAPVSSGGHAVIVYSRGRGEAVVELADLPSLPDGRVYQLWLMDTGGAATARSAGLVDASGAVVNAQVLSPALDDATAVGLTVEPPGGTAEPTTTPIMVAALET
jgi:anti-sigma-K factor RskA